MIKLFLLLFPCFVFARPIDMTLPSKGEYAEVKDYIIERFLRDYEVLFDIKSHENMKRHDVFVKIKLYGEILQYIQDLEDQ